VKCLDLYGLVKLAGFDPDFLDQIGSLKRLNQPLEPVLRNSAMSAIPPFRRPI
jgi:hypothetical protein